MRAAESRCLSFVVSRAAWREGWREGEGKGGKEGEEQREGERKRGGDSTRGVSIRGGINSDSTEKGRGRYLHPQSLVSSRRCRELLTKRLHLW